MSRASGEASESQERATPWRGPAAVGRILFVLAAGVLLSTLLSCGCAPIR